MRNDYKITDAGVRDWVGAIRLYARIMRRSHRGSAESEFARRTIAAFVYCASGALDVQGNRVRYCKRVQRVNVSVTLPPGGGAEVRALLARMDG